MIVLGYIGKHVGREDKIKREHGRVPKYLRLERYAQEKVVIS